jgi:hypothetical protein
MKIIGKYKDYYDYLVGIYGEDPLLVYVRNGVPLTSNRTFFSHYLNPYKYPKNVIEKHFYIKDAFGKITEFDKGIPFKKEQKTHWYLWRFLDEHHTKRLHKEHYGHIETFFLYVGYERYQFELDRYKEKNGTIVDDIEFKKVRVEDKDRECNAPIYIHMDATECKSVDKYIVNPILKDTFISSIIPAEEIWDSLSEYIGLQKEVTPRPLTDKQKIEQHGFDNKTSFRNVK